MPGYKHGGEVKETGMAKVHKGEHVIPKHMVKALGKHIKESHAAHKDLAKGK